jgi:hypothetical protein
VKPIIQLVDSRIILTSAFDYKCGYLQRSLWARIVLGVRSKHQYVGGEFLILTAGSFLCEQIEGSLCSASIVQRIFVRDSVGRISYFISSSDYVALLPTSRAFENECTLSFSVF